MTPVAERPGGLRLAVAGKGGAGKSVVSGTLARVLARRGHRVLALDSDTLPGIAWSIGAGVSEEQTDVPLNSAAWRDEKGRWHLNKGVGAARAVQRYSTAAPDGVRLLQIGKNDRRGVGPNRASHNAFWQVVHKLDDVPSLRGWTFIGDLPAGARQAAYDWAPYARHFLLVVEPTWQSMLTSRRIARIMRTMRDGEVEFSLVVNKVAADDDAERVQEFLDMPLIAAVPADDDVKAAERAGVALLDAAPDSPVVRAIEGLADALDAASIERI